MPCSVFNAEWVFALCSLHLDCFQLEVLVYLVDLVAEEVGLREELGRGVVDLELDGIFAFGLGLLVAGQWLHDL